MHIEVIVDIEPSEASKLLELIANSSFKGVSHVF